MVRYVFNTAYIDIYAVFFVALRQKGNGVYTLKFIVIMLQYKNIRIDKWGVFMAVFFSPLTKNIGIDLGTCTTNVWVESRGVVWSEPSIVVIREGIPIQIAVGNAAERLLAKTEGTAKIQYPLDNGTISDYQVTCDMLGYLLNKCVRSVQQLRIMVGISAGASNVEKRAVMEALYQVGAKEALLIDTGVAAALSVSQASTESSTMVIDMGGGTTNVALIAFGGIVFSTSIHQGSLVYNQVIREYLRSRYDIGVDEQTIEAIKKYCGTAVLPIENKSFEFVGRKLDSGRQSKLSITTSELYPVIGRPLQKIATLVRQVLQEIPPELIADIMVNGIALTGGGANLVGVDTFFSQLLGLPVRVVDEPELAVIRGIGIAWQEREYVSACIEDTSCVYKRRL